MSTATKYIFNQKEEDSDTANILISGEIDDFWGIGLRQMANEIAGSGASNIMLQINSPGGSVTEGQAIASFIKGFPATINTNGIGLVASIATTILLAGEKVSLADGAWFMIHNPWTVAGGEADDLRDTADLLDKMRDQLANTYVDAIAKNGKLINKRKDSTFKQVIEWMDNETWFTAQEALDAGFIDNVTEGVELMNKSMASGIMNKIKDFKNTPESFLNTIKNLTAVDEDSCETISNKSNITMADPTNEGMFAAIKNFFLGEEETEEETVETTEETTEEETPEATAEEKIAQAKALLIEAGVYKEPAKEKEEVKAVVETESSETEDILAKMQAKLDEQELKLQRMQEENDGAPSAGDESASSSTKAKKSLTKQLMPTEEHKNFFGDIAKAIMN